MTKASTGNVPGHCFLPLRPPAKQSNMVLCEESGLEWPDTQSFLQAPSHFLVGCYLIALRGILHTENIGVDLDLGNGGPSFELFTEGVFPVGR